VKLVIQSFAREKISMAKGKSQQTDMTAEINSIPTYAIYTNVQYKEEAYLDPTFDDVPLLSTLTQSFIPASSSQQTRKESI
jgi:hypothetical protein